MGILLANIVAFGLPEAAYFSPLAWGGADGWDRAAWYVNFVFVEGRMRGLFSLLFGASLLLVIDRAEASGRSGAAVHLRRMAALFAIGCAHLYLLWWGDILAHYALVGMLALLFVPASTRWLVAGAIALLVAGTLLNLTQAALLFDSAARTTATQRETWQAFAYAFGVPPRAHLLAEIAAMRGDWGGAVAWRWRWAIDPFTFLPMGGLETMSAVLLGMAAYRARFVTGEWPRRRYVLVAAFCVPLSLAGYAVLGAVTVASGFDQRWVFFGSIVGSAGFRVLGFVGYAALLMILLRPGTAIADRVGAVGRMAFSNYLGTTILMDLVFTGVGLARFGTMGRASLYWLVSPTWLLMLLWSPWWLSLFAYGPFEWLWRSIARARVQPMRRQDATNRTA